jgi:hypothetical protein
VSDMPHPKSKGCPKAGSSSPAISAGCGLRAVKTTIAIRAPAATASVTHKAGARSHLSAMTIATSPATSIRTTPTK